MDGWNIIDVMYAFIFRTTLYDIPTFFGFHFCCQYRKVPKKKLIYSRKKNCSMKFGWSASNLVEYKCNTNYQFSKQLRCLEPYIYKSEIIKKNDLDYRWSISFITFSRPKIVEKEIPKVKFSNKVKTFLCVKFRLKSVKVQLSGQ